MSDITPAPFQFLEAAAEDLKECITIDPALLKKFSESREEEEEDEDKGGGTHEVIYEDFLPKAHLFWSNCLQNPCSDDAGSHDRLYQEAKRLVKANLYIKLPYMIREFDVNFFGVFVPFSVESRHQTNKNLEGFVSLHNDARPFVRIPQKFKEVIEDYEREVERGSRSRSRSRSRSYTGSALQSRASLKVPKVDFVNPTPLLSDAFLQALQVEKAVCEPSILSDDIKRNADWKGNYAKLCAARRDNDVTDYLGPLGLIVYFAVFGESTLIPLKEVYNIDLLKVIRHAYLNCNAETNKHVQDKLRSSQAEILNHYSLPGVTGRRFLLTDKCAPRKKVEDETEGFYDGGEAEA